VKTKGAGKVPPAGPARVNARLILIRDGRLEDGGIVAVIVGEIMVRRVVRTVPMRLVVPSVIAAVVIGRIVGAASCMVVAAGIAGPGVAAMTGTVVAAAVMAAAVVTTALIREGCGRHWQRREADGSRHQNKRGESRAAALANHRRMIFDEHHFMHST
jgi:hypothetical protein